MEFGIRMRQDSYVQGFLGTYMVSFTSTFFKKVVYGVIIDIKIHRFNV